ncbi:MAG TPA: hypothetical protein VIV54_06380 [Burkholderiales bacterium]
MNPILGPLIVFLASAAICTPLFAQEEAASRRASIERRVASVQTLIESSSAAREVEKSGRSDALTRRSQARESVRLAREALESGDLTSASSLAEDATKHLIAAARLARDEAVHADETGGDLRVRMDSARALLAALRRIGTEKAAPDAAQLAPRIESLLAEAQSHVDAGRIAPARPLAEQAYLLAKAGVTAMRGGDTLVRSLKFTSKEDEYHYELDRNETHAMLLTLALKQQPFGLSEGLERSRALRRDAEAKAARGGHAEAIRLLEESTRELVRGIRAAGLYIPG